MFDELPEDRARRRRRRLTFEHVADLYESSRRGYPAELLEVVVRTAELSPGSSALEIGCGTGQLTRQLVPLGLDLTAIDIAPSMVSAARRIVGDDVRFEACAFEDLDVPDGTFDLVISATAFHWIDPEVGFVKAAALLRPGGWLALLATGEVYDDPLGSALRALWSGLSDAGSPSSATRPDDVEVALATGTFQRPVARTHDARLTLAPAAVAAVERTRATVLDYPPELRRRYDRGLDVLLEGLDEVWLTQRTTLLMLQRAS